MAAFGLPQQQRQQRGLPVVTVHDVSLEVLQAQRLDHGLAEEDEAVGVVLEVPLAVAVGGAPVEEFLAADQIHPEVPAGRKNPDVTRKKLVAHLDLQPPFPLRPGRVPMLQRGAISRQKNGDFVAVVRQRRGERTDGIRQSAGLDVGE